MPTLSAVQLYESWYCNCTAMLPVALGIAYATANIWTSFCLDSTVMCIYPRHTHSWRALHVSRIWHVKRSNSRFHAFCHLHKLGFPSSRVPLYISSFINSPITTHTSNTQEIFHRFPRISALPHDFPSRTLVVARLDRWPPRVVLSRSSMASPSFIPVLTQEDIERAAQASFDYCSLFPNLTSTSDRQLIQQAYAPAPQNHLSSEDQRRIQQELFEIQKRHEAWGLVMPFLGHSDPNIQFFGAHTAQVKVARDWWEDHMCIGRILFTLLDAHCNE